jgi:UDP-N-acetylglucosamine--N-acetylmuramyl-(pentapeptide) pyrophosphoryl-undecaprenol N-acetylglucosamine transferase
MQQRNYRIVISGGGTGGHIFPAIAIARALKEKLPLCEILFIGAKGKMEMEKVPAAGFPIKGLWISGLRRDLSLSTLLFPIKVVTSLFKAIWTLKSFRADVAVGVGGFASGPALRAASMLGLPTLIQEQNSYPGITNKLLGKKATKICVAFPEMEKFFPAQKIVITGNPVRKEVTDIQNKRLEAASFFGLDAGRKTLFIVGGSQGALSVNTYIEQMIPFLKEQNVQLLWQTGRYFSSRAREAQKRHHFGDCHITEFIHRMDLAYALADVVVSRAGAIAIAELAAVRKAVIFIPLPTAAADHQMKNAQRLAEKNAAIVIRDPEAPEKLPFVLQELLHDENKRDELQKNIAEFDMPGAASKIADEIIALLEK